MKILQSYIISTILIFINCCGTAQNNASEKQAENMLLEFYTKHFQVWENSSLSSEGRYKTLDSLMQKYCTSKLRNEAREVFKNVGADFLTNDLIGDINENLKVEKDAANEFLYIISFISDIATYADPHGEQTKKQVTLHVTVVKEGDIYKIDSVK
jgi:hypothetical protein